MSRSALAGATAWIGMFAAGLLWAGDVAASRGSFSSKDVRLEAVRGVPNEPVHRYELRGQLVITYGDQLVVVYKGWATVAGEWTAHRKEATEKIQIEGKLAGYAKVRMKCHDDPWITSSSCTILEVKSTHAEQEINWRSLYWQVQRPMTASQVSYSQAAAMSGAAANNAPPPPPPPRPPYVVDPKKAPIKEVGGLGIQSPSHLPATVEKSGLKQKELSDPDKKSLMMR